MVPNVARKVTRMLLKVKIQKGARFQATPCFPGGRRRVPLRRVGEFSAAGQGATVNARFALAAADGVHRIVEGFDVPLAFRPQFGGVVHTGLGDHALVIKHDGRVVGAGDGPALSAPDVVVPGLGHLVIADAQGGHQFIERHQRAAQGHGGVVHGMDVQQVADRAAGQTGEHLGFVVTVRNDQ